VKCVVHRVPNKDSIADSARAAIVLSQGRLSFGRARKQFSPTRHLRSIDSKSFALPPEVGIRLKATEVGESPYHPELDTTYGVLSR
jgi:hypothetical protein